MAHTGQAQPGLKNTSVNGATNPSKFNKLQDTDVSRMSEELTEKGSEFLGGARENVSHLVEQGSETVRGWISDTGTMITDAEKGVRENIKRHPVEAVLIGLGIGCAVGMLFSFLRNRE